MKEILPSLKVLLTLMTTPSRFRYWEAKEDLYIPANIMPTWIATLNALECLELQIEQEESNNHQISEHDLNG